jgi:CRISPR system Cascade subunit CasE
MFLSRLFLNIRDQQARKDLARAYEMHRTILTCGFGSIGKEELGRVLFRVDSDRHGGKPVLIVQSDAAPDWSKLPVGYLVRTAEAKEVALQFALNQRLQFRLRANPTKKVAEKNEHLGAMMVGKRVGLVTEAQQIRWLLRKAERGGFRIPGEWVKARHPETGEEVEQPNFRVDARPEGRVHNTKREFGGEFHAVLFEGILEVTDPAAFQNTIAAGVGSGKAFGFGLLSVARA